MEVKAVSTLLDKSGLLTGSTGAMKTLTAQSASLVSGGASSEPQADNAIGGGWGNEPPAAAFAVAVAVGGGWGNEPPKP
jgi:hypothetical protein